MNNQYIVNCRNVDERLVLYNYLINNNYQPVHIYQDIINNKFPFVIESNNTFWICESITCCAAAVSCGVMITIEEFFNQINANKKTLLIKKDKLK